MIFNALYFDKKIENSLKLYSYLRFFSGVRYADLFKITYKTFPIEKYVNIWIKVHTDIFFDSTNKKPYVFNNILNYKIINIKTKYIFVIL